MHILQHKCNKEFSNILVTLSILLFQDHSDRVRLPGAERPLRRVLRLPLPQPRRHQQQEAGLCQVLHQAAQHLRQQAQERPRCQAEQAQEEDPGDPELDRDHHTGT